MKHLKHLCAALALTLAFVLPTFAGHIPCGVDDPPPPPDAPPATCVDSSGVTLTNNEASEGLAETALTLLQSVLSVL